MSNVSRGFAFEREVKKHFLNAGWGCTRAAHSASIMDLIAFLHLPRAESREYVNVNNIFVENGYFIKRSKSEKIILTWLASKRDGKYIKHVYFNTVFSERFVVVLMQCKIKKCKIKKR